MVSFLKCAMMRERSGTTGPLGDGEGEVRKGGGGRRGGGRGGGRGRGGKVTNDEYRN